MVGAAPAKRRTRLPRAEREAEILEAARRVFSERGYADAAVSEVATEAGVAEGTVFSYFETKRALLVAVMQGFYDDLIRDTVAGLDAVRGVENRLRFLIQRHLETFTADRGLCRVVIREARPDAALYDEAFIDLNRRYTGITLATLEEGVETGVLREDIVPSVIRDLIYGGIEHAVWRHVFGDGEIEIALLAEQLADSILGGILVERQTEEDTVIRLERAIERLESTVAGSSNE